MEAAPTGDPRIAVKVLGRLDGSAGATEAERSADRHQRIAAATFAGIGARVLSAVALLAALPLASSQLNRAELGVWSLLVTAVALLGFADLGLGNGLLNVLSDAIGKGDDETARRAVTGTVVGLSAVAIGGALLVPVLLWLVPWYSLLGVTRQEVPQLETAILVFAATVLVSIPAGVGQRVHLAYQQGWAASLTSGLGSLVALVCIGLSALLQAPLPWFVAAMLGGPALACVGETVWVFARSHRDLVPRRDRLDAAVLRRVVRSGALFFVLASAGAAAYQSDTLVIAHYLGAAEVTRYAVSLRLFTLVPTALAAMLLPLWPAYGEAIARRDDAWVRATLRRTLLISFGASAASSLALLVLARPILRAWAPTTFEPSSSLLIAMALWAIVGAVSMAVAMYLNGANIIRFQVIAASTMAIANLALSIAFVQRFGIAGPVWASALTQTFIILVPAALFVLPSLRATTEPLAPSEITP